MTVPAVPADHLPQVLRHAVIGLVRRDGPDLSARQLAVFLICYLEEGPHTVRGLAAQLGVSKPAITRSLDRLGALGLARRAEDPRDRRSVVVQRTRNGLDLLADMRTLLMAGGELVKGAAPAARQAAQPPVPQPGD
jgi:DNA-binding MarR family transcriptional regulator